MSSWIIHNNDVYCCAEALVIQVGFIMICVMPKSIKHQSSKHLLHSEASHFLAKTCMDDVLLKTQLTSGK